MTKSSGSSGTPDRWLILLLVALSYFTLYLHRNLVNYLQPPIKDAFGVSIPDADFVNARTPRALLQIIEAQRVA